MFWSFINPNNFCQRGNEVRLRESRLEDIAQAVTGQRWSAGNVSASFAQTGKERDRERGRGVETYLCWRHSRIAAARLRFGRLGGLGRRAGWQTIATILLAIRNWISIAAVAHLSGPNADVADVGAAIETAAAAVVVVAHRLQLGVSKKMANETSFN